jgi:DNA excision repair protein ERCC-4
MDTRTGGGKKTAQKERRDIAVDVREFRSSLPSVLHQGGMRLAPVTLTVGDFVLSNVHCVERKSINDLFGSFASGRLYSQVRIPEFNGTFLLQLTYTSYSRPRL